MLRWIWMTKEQILDVPLRGSKRFLNAKRGKCRDCEERTCPRTSYCQHTANLLERCMGNMLYHIGSILDSLSLSYIYIHIYYVCMYIFTHIHIHFVSISCKSRQVHANTITYYIIFVGNPSLHLQVTRPLLPNAALTDFKTKIFPWRLATNSPNGFVSK